MTASWWSDDDQLLVVLREALREERDVPSRFVEVAESAFAWHLADADQAALSDESLVEVPLVVSGCVEQSGVREFVFAGSDFTIQVGVSATSLLGRVVPLQRGEVEVYERGGSPRIFKVDEQGWFTAPRPRASYRLLYRRREGPSAVTEWLTV